MSVKTPPPPVKEQLHAIADQLDDDATWEDAAYQVYVRQELEASIKEADAGQLIPQAEVEKMFLGE